MLRSAKSIEGYTLHARDGVIGHVRDFYFDETEWKIRYFVVETGSWLRSRKVLIAPSAAKLPGWQEEFLPVDLTKEQIRHSPDIDFAKPVSRQYEEALNRHYGWTPYWLGVYADPLGMAAVPAVPPAPAGGPDDDAPHGDPHLRSAREVIAHRLQATDGEIGHVADLLVEPDGWAIRYVVVDTRNWIPGRKVVISPWWISEIDWPAGVVRVDLTRATVEGSPPYDPEAPMPSDYYTQLNAYYGRPPRQPAEAPPAATRDLM